MTKRQCLRCGKVYEDKKASPFRTCPECRVAVIDDGGGCHWWTMAAPDPRVTRHKEVLDIDIGPS